MSENHRAHFTFPKAPRDATHIERRHGGLQRGGDSCDGDRTCARCRIPETEIELVVVESNSTDGTREIVSQYAADPRVRLVLQDAPKGKGAAVREGFEHVTGGIVLIQDADLEYSVDDYPKLIDPIRRGDVDFTLGCRHVPGRRMRVMDEMRNVARIVNMAHWVFTWFFNVTYRTRLRDPFTMYKVFRRECIDGVEFVADRFDFDWELAGKLVRLGYDR